MQNTDNYFIHYNSEIFLKFINKFLKKDKCEINDLLQLELFQKSIIDTLTKA